MASAGASEELCRRAHEHDAAYEYTCRILNFIDASILPEPTLLGRVSQLDHVICGQAEAVRLLLGTVRAVCRRWREETATAKASGESDDAAVHADELCEALRKSGWEV